MCTCGLSGCWNSLRDTQEPLEKDLALIYSSVMCTAASTYTLNKVKGAPIAVTKRHLQDGHAQAIICNSGNANTCNANGEEIANRMCELCAQELNLNAEDIIVVFVPESLVSR